MTSANRIHPMNSMSAPSPVIAALLRNLFKTRRFILRYLALPRSPRSRKLYIPAHPSKLDSERYHARKIRAFPWYIAPTTSWKLKAWLKGLPQPGPSFHSSGYRILDLGPDVLVGKGKVEMAEMDRSVRTARNPLILG
jgi:hypothetical protein